MKKLPPAQRRFPPLPPSASDAHRVVRTWEVKFGRLVSEMTPHQISQMTNSDPFRRGEASIEYFRGTAVEPILRRELRKYRALSFSFATGIALGVGIGFVTHSGIIGFAAAFALGIIFLGIANRVIYRSLWRSKH